MKPKTIDEILIYAIGCCDGIPDIEEKEAIDECKQQLLDLFMSCVPEECDSVGPYYDEGWNDCRDQMIKNLEKLWKI